MNHEQVGIHCGNIIYHKDAEGKIHRIPLKKYVMGNLEWFCIGLAFGITCTWVIMEIIFKLY